MRAVFYERYGAAAEVLRVSELPDPTPGPGEVLVRVHASGINPSDVKTRAGSQASVPPAPRIVPHNDGAGIIAAVGPGVPAARVGQRVWTWNANRNWNDGTQQGPAGTAAELVALPAHMAVPLPENTSFLEGACLGVPAMTAHRAIFGDGAVAGQTLLVTGGAGGVGFYGIQLAKWGGARVIATVSGPAKAAHAQAAGADHVLNYREPGLAARIMEITGGTGVDRIVEVDFGGNIETSMAVLKAGGTIAWYASGGAPKPQLDALGTMRRNLNFRGVLVYSMPAEAKADATADTVRWLESGTGRHLIAATFPLERIVEAHEAQEAFPTGKVVVEIA